MGLRWTKNDTAAFDATMKAGEAIRGMYDQYMAGQAYNEGAGLGAVDSSEYRKYADMYRETNPDAAAAYDRAAEAGYAVPSKQDRRAAGLGSQAEFYSRRGDVRRANELYDQIDQMGLRKVQYEAAQDQLARGKRADQREIDRDTALEAYKKQVADPKAYLVDKFNKDEIGGEDMKGYKVQTVDTADGVMAFVVDGEGKALIRNGSPVAKHMTMDQVNDLAFETFLQKVDPVELAKHKRGVRKDQSEADYRAGVIRYHEKDGEERARHNKATENILSQKAENAGAKGLEWKPQSVNDDGTLTYVRTNKKGELEFKVAKPTDENGKPVDPKYVKGMGPQKEATPGKPVITFEKFLEVFPPQKGETEMAAYRRYQRFQNPEAGKGGMSALGQANAGMGGNPAPTGLGFRTTNGGHPAVDAPNMTRIQPNPVQAEIDDLRTRMNFPGVSDETKLKFGLRIMELQNGGAQLPMSMSR